jgi:V/A-type H+-transporting ATPase subunit I
MLVTMRRIDIIAPRSLAGRVLRTIHRSGLVHLAAFEPPSGPGASIFSAEPGGRERSARRDDPLQGSMDRLGQLAALLALPGAPRALVTELWELDDDALVGRVAALEPVARRAAESTADAQRLRGEAARLAGYRQIIDGLRRAVGHLPAVRGYGSTGIVVRARYRAVVPLVRDELEALTDSRCEVLSADIDAERVAAVLIYPLRLAPEVRAMLGGRDLEEVTLPESLVAVPFDELAPRLRDEEAALEGRADAAERELARLAAEHGPLVSALRLVLGDRIAEARALEAAGRSDHLSVVAGWVPADRLEELRTRLEREVGPEVLVVERAVDPASRSAPVALQNRRFLRAFEPLASFVTLPRYGTVDPTPAVAFAFPVFVGLMVGDIGYGLVVLALLALARWRWRSVPAMAVIWPIGLLAAASTVVFGVLYGELFGDAGHQLLGLEPLLFDRREAVLPLLLLAIWIGVAQVGLGLVLGIVNATRMRHRREAVGRGGLLVALVAGIVGLAALAGIVPMWLGGVAVVGLAVVLVVMTATLGLAGPIEMMGMVGNVLSYARLMAIGLASVMLALVANRMGDMVGNVVLGIVIATVFHALAIVLGFFDSSVQGLRLQYVEFFSKFVEPGGTRYEPFVSVLGQAGLDPGPAGGT